MSKQTINIGASPNDGTGTPLRTSFDYTNQNFTELYTAVGPSGNNIVVPGNATITGDLNVSGNGAFTGTGYVALQRPLIPVGENGNTTLDYRWYSTGTTYVTGARVHSSSDAAWTVSSTPARLMFSTVPSGSTTLVERYRIDNTGISTWSVAGTTAMTLNSTGLGIGVSPATKLHIAGIGTQILRVQTNTSGDPTLNLTAAGADACSILFDRTNNYLRFDVSSITGALIVNTAGNVGIGVTPSAWQTGLKALQFAANGVLYGNGTNGSFFGNNYYTNSSGDNKYLLTNYATAYGQVSGAHQWYSAAIGTAGDTITDFATAKMVLTASGNLLLGAAVATAQGRQEITFDGATAQGLNVVDSSAAATSTAIGFIKSAGTRGNILVTAVGTTYNTVSDYRLKESVKPISGGLARVNSLKPSSYNWKSAGSTGEGFLAHELAEVVPSAVSGEKDAVNADGSINAQSVDMSRIVPILVAAIQELTAEVNALKNA